MSLPYITTLIIFIFILFVRNNRIRSYENFLKNSPGIYIDSTGLEFGTGHPVEKNTK